MIAYSIKYASVVSGVNPLFLEGFYVLNNVTINVLTKIKIVQIL